MSAKLPRKSSKKGGGKLVPRSEQAVAAPSTQIAEPSSDGVKVLLAVFQALLARTYNPDVLHLALKRARRECPEISDERFKEISDGIINWNDALTANDPIRSLFR